MEDGDVAMKRYLKRKQKLKDPNRPKRAITAWIAFCNDKKPEVKKENPLLTEYEAVKVLSERWKELDDEQKMPYQEIADKDKKRYKQELEAYERKMKDAAAVSEAPKEEKTVDAEKGEETKTQKKVKVKKWTGKGKDPNKPRRAITCWIAYCNDKRDEVKRENPSWMMTDIIKHLSNNFKNLEDDQKKPYQEIAEKDKLRYKKEMLVYMETQKDGDEDEGKVEAEGKDDDDVVKKKQHVLENHTFNPNKPRRAVTAWIAFCNDKRDEFKKNNPSLKLTEITIALSDKWKDLTNDEKQPYQAVADKDLIRYNKEMGAYDEVVTKRPTPKKRKAPSQKSMKDEDNDDEAATEQKRRPPMRKAAVKAIAKLAEGRPATRKRNSQNKVKSKSKVKAKSKLKSKAANKSRK